MASKKMKKALAIGLGVGLGAKFLAGKARAASIANNEAKEFGYGKMKKNYITKKVKNKTFMGKVKDAVNVYKEKGFKTPPGPNATSKKGGTLAGDYGGAFDYFDLNTGGQATKMVKARGGKLVNLKPTKMS